jgi:threonine/homoserine/homoserine lactone efflux protein
MQSHLLVSFTVACIVLNLVPGPGMMFMMAHGITGGRRAGVAAAFGMASGTTIHTVAAALGLSALLAAAPHALDVVRVGGAIFLLYLAIQALRESGKPGRESLGTVNASGVRSLERTYLSAILTNLANPKVVLFFLAFVPQFITPSGWSTTTQILLLGALLVTIGLVMDAGIGLAAGTFATTLEKRPSIQAWLRRTSAAVFGGLALRLLVSPSH